MLMIDGKTESKGRRKSEHGKSGTGLFFISTSSLDLFPLFFFLKNSLSVPVAKLSYNPPFYSASHTRWERNKMRSLEVYFSLFVLDIEASLSLAFFF